jgi:hypothetical protein
VCRSFALKIFSFVRARQKMSNETSRPSSTNHSVVTIWDLKDWNFTFRIDRYRVQVIHVWLVTRNSLRHPNPFDFCRPWPNLSLLLFL